MNDKFFEGDKFDFSSIINEEPEFITLLSSEDEERLIKESVPSVLPILPLRNTVLFPGVVMPITVGRDKSIQLIKEAYKSDKTIGAVAQKDAEVDDPKIEDLYRIGTVAHIIKLLQMPDGSTTAIIQGKRRFVIGSIIQYEPYIKANVLTFSSDTDNLDKYSDDKTFEALISSIKDMAIKIVNMSPNLPTEAAFAIRNIESPSFLVHFISSNLNIKLEEKQKILEVNDIFERAQLVLKYMAQELQYLELKNSITNKVKRDIDKQQRDYFLSQQLKTIQEELGVNPHEQEINELREKAKTKKWSQTVAEAFQKEVDKLQRMNPAAAEYSMQMNYVQTLIDLPWDEMTTDNFDLVNAQKILDEDHYGLEKVKERIIEFLAVLKLRKDLKSPILCLVGPPGVGKTSLGKSIARALGRNYVRMSLGGLRDEAEIRGHRKTYIGAMPGRIIQNIKKAKSSNPVFVLDEIDKVGSHSIHGDPSSALLEVLDPEQNTAFHDNYLELDYDLSNVMFIATANTLSTIQPALRDRMEIIEISGYILEEKIEIARRHLIPKQIKEHGLSEYKLTFPKKTIVSIIEDYTRESGVRELEKKIAKALRWHARFIANDEKINTKIEPDLLPKIYGPPIFKKEKFFPTDLPGVAIGLAWTVVGGDILFIETVRSKGKGQLTQTGNLGDVMKESATIAFEFIKAYAEKLNINQEILDNSNVHIHVPEGSTPKDGPSAGITIFSALLSLFLEKPIKKNIAMTGEITLRGKVLPVGGIKEKILAAKRHKINNIILPLENRKDVEDIQPIYLKGLKFHYIENMLDILKIIF